MTDAAELVKLAEIAGQPDRSNSRSLLELALRDAYAAGCAAAQNRSLVVALQYAATETPKLLQTARAALAAQQDGARELLAELRRLHEKTGWQSTADLLSRYEQ